MKPEEKVITFEQAEKLAELVEKKGIKLPSSERIWYINNKKLIFLEHRLRDILGYPAYDIAEMMEIMKKFNEKLDVGIILEVIENKWAACLGDLYDYKSYETKLHKILAEALGELLICLVENDKLK